MKLISKIAVIGGALALVASAQASLVNTGIDANNDGIDDNWKLVNVTPALPGTTIPNAYIATTTPTGSFPLDGTWMPNDATSKWITYDTPMSTGGMTPNHTFDYQLTFVADGTTSIRWLSDNSSMVYLSEGATRSASAVLIGSRTAPVSFSSFNDWIALNLQQGQTYTLDIDVLNIDQSFGNPTGVRLEAVPEPTTVIAGALVLLPFGVSTLRVLRNRRK